MAELSAAVLADASAAAGSVLTGRPDSRDRPRATVRAGRGAAVEEFFAVGALGVSVGTFWWTSVWRGRLSVVRPPFFGIEPTSALGRGNRLRVNVPLVIYTTGSRPQPVVHLRAALRHAGGVLEFSRWRVREGEEIAACGCGVATPEGWSAQHCLKAEESLPTIPAGPAALGLAARPASSMTVEFTIDEKAVGGLRANGRPQVYRDAAGEYRCDEGHW